MSVIPIETGEVFLQDKIVSETNCYICKKEFNKFDDKDMLLLRVKEHVFIIKLIKFFLADITISFTNYFIL
jgi:hypothetical protein